MSEGLLPTADPVRKERVTGPLPAEARRWRRILDLDELQAGDLLLFRPFESERADWTTQEIVKAQLDGGYGTKDARWTHAAVYLGDGESLCEANIGLAGFPNGIIVRSAHGYCDGQTVVRARRPKEMSPRQRLRIAIGALHHIGKGYSYRQAYQFRKAARSGKGFWQTLDRGPKINVRALVCSTLYQDALTYAQQGSRIRLGVYCTPAELSASPDFETIEPALNWIAIE